MLLAEPLSVESEESEPGKHVQPTGSEELRARARRHMLTIMILRWGDVSWSRTVPVWSFDTGGDTLVVAERRSSWFVTVHRSTAFQRALASSPASRYEVWQDSAE